MRIASYVGFIAMIVIGIAAFVWASPWWFSALLILVALAVGLYSVGLYARASTQAAARALRGLATESDYEELDRLGDRGRQEAFERASLDPDPQRDELFRSFLAEAGGQEGAERLVIEHMARTQGRQLDENDADQALDLWRRFGIVRNETLEEFLDRVGGALDELDS